MQSLRRTIFLITALAAGAPAVSQTTQPAPSPAGTDTLTVAVWTCPQHEKFRMAGKGACPACQSNLVRREITLQGAGAAGDLYPLDTCSISGKRLGAMGEPVIMVHEGRELRFCGAGCIKAFESDPAGSLEEIDRKIVEQQLPYYPLATCPVSGEPLGSMGEPVDYVHNNRLVRFCCKGCLRAFKKDPADFLAALDQAVIDQQKDHYPLETCIISQQKLGSMGEPVDYVVANRLVRFCCAGCATGFYKMPATHLAKLDEAWPRKDAESVHGKGNHDHGHDHDHDH